MRPVKKAVSGAKRLSHALPDRLYLQLKFFSRFKRFVNFRNPRTFNEKLQWLKLNYRVPSDEALVDKFSVKEWVAERIGSEYVIPTLAVHDSLEEIKLEDLPNEFVLKCTHDSGGVMLVRDKSRVDARAISEKLGRSMRRNYFYSGREPQYLNLQPRVIAEPFLEDTRHGQLIDYKFFCFDGEVKAMFVASDRSSGHVKFDYFDAEYNSLDLRQPYPNSTVPPEKPAKFEEMLAISRKLSDGHPHVRVDLYEVNGRVYFGEMTFFHFSGLQPFIPSYWDKKFGDWLNLPSTKRAR